MDRLGNLLEGDVDAEELLDDGRLVQVREAVPVDVLGELLAQPLSLASGVPNDRRNGVEPRLRGRGNAAKAGDEVVLTVVASTDGDGGKHTVSLDRCCEASDVGQGATNVASLMNLGQRDDRCRELGCCGCHVVLLMERMRRPRPGRPRTGSAAAFRQPHRRGRASGLPQWPAYPQSGGCC